MKLSHRRLHQALDSLLLQYKELGDRLPPAQKFVEGQSVANHVSGHIRKVTDLTNSQRV